MADVGPRAAHRVARRAVDALPAPARRWVRIRRRRSATSAVSPGELDAVLDEAARMFARTEDEARRFLSGVRMAPPPWPADPFSDGYRGWVFDLYRLVSGRDGYSVVHEGSPFDLRAAIDRPFPFATGSATVVGDDLLARGHLVKSLGLSAPERIVEFGPGWGNLTADLVAMGHEVTAVEVDEGFCRLLAARCPGAAVVRSDMLGFVASRPATPAPSARPTPPAPYAAAVFFESFHHCADHMEMLRRLHHVVSPGGVVAFAAEPVDVLEYPWGPRLDGLSLWSTRRYGWLELGFDERYFASALARTGWRAVRIPGPAPSATVYLAHRR